MKRIQCFAEIYKDKVNDSALFSVFLEGLRVVTSKPPVATSAPRANLDLIINALKLQIKMDSMMSSEIGQ